MISLEAAGDGEAGEARAGRTKAWERVGLSEVGLTRFLGRARKAAGVAGEVDVLLAGDRTLRRLNREFRGKDKATDVLSFPAGASTVFFGGPELAGDLAISLETAARQARAFGHSLEDEVKVLLLHGMLHLAGLDHEADAGEMEVREAELRRELGLMGGLIGRVIGEGSGGARQPQVLRLRAARFAQDDKRRTNAGVPRVAQDDKRKARQKQDLRYAQDDNLEKSRLGRDDERKAPHPAAIKPRRGWGTRAKKRVGA